MREELSAEQKEELEAAFRRLSPERVELVLAQIFQCIVLRLIPQSKDEDYANPGNYRQVIYGFHCSPSSYLCLFSYLFLSAIVSALGQFQLQFICCALLCFTWMWPVFVCFILLICCFLFWIVFYLVTFFLKGEEPPMHIVCDKLLAVEHILLFFCFDFIDIIKETNILQFSHCRFYSRTHNWILSITF